MEGSLQFQCFASIRGKTVTEECALEFLGNEISCIFKLHTETEVLREGMFTAAVMQVKTN